MATNFEQISARRKFLYFGLIVLLLTLSLLHRKFVINAQADELMLREVGRGKADLTDSAVRLTLSGVRGVAVTSLWLAAIEKQRRHEWNELEVAVESLTRLQPRFTSPWLFQGWNLAFNVAVECDWARDKYYYISRGITLLARGEEKNDPGQAVPPRPWPANTEMRYNIGFFYQLKIATSDENKTMRSLFDMSCMPLSKRNPDQFYKIGERGKQLNLEAFKQFCEANPRMVRRLREQLSGFEQPLDIVQFLTEYKDIPGRIEDRSRLQDEKRVEEFPILPPPSLAQPQYPNWQNESLTTATTDFDVYGLTRAWYSYAQLPMPPASRDPFKYQGEYEREKHSLPKMAGIIFRGYPARSQMYIAEGLEKEGWFDGEGWVVKGWFDSPTAVNAPPIKMGAGPKYHAGQAWREAYDLYFAYGQQNGLYYPPAELKKMMDLTTSNPTSADAKFAFALMSNRQMTNFEELFRQTSVEKTPEAVAARKEIFEVEKYKANDIRVLANYRDRLLPQWLDLVLKYPEFRQLSTVQEESYELMTRYFFKLQWYNKPFFENLVIGMAYSVPTWNMPGYCLPLLDSSGEIWPRAVLKNSIEKKGVKVLFLRDIEGLYDQMFVWDGPEADAIKPVAEALARGVLWPPLPADPKAPDVAFARYVVWPPAGDASARPEIGLGLRYTGKENWEDKFRPINPELVSAVAGVAAGGACPVPRFFVPTPDTVLAVAGAAAGGAWPMPRFTMLSSAEERRIPTLIGSHQSPPTAAGWTALVAPNTVVQARQNITWLKPRPQ